LAVFRVEERSGRRLVLVFEPRDKRFHDISMRRPEVGGLDVLFEGGENPMRGVHLHIEKARIIIEGAEER